MRPGTRGRCWNSLLSPCPLSPGSRGRLDVIVGWEEGKFPGWCSCWDRELRQAAQSSGVPHARSVPCEATCHNGSIIQLGNQHPNLTEPQFPHR